MPTLVTGFCSARPTHQLSQDISLDWLAAAHARAEATQSKLNGALLDELAFRTTIRRHFERFGCSSRQIASRGVELDDCTHQDFSQMDVFGVERAPAGATTRVRTEAFDKAVRRVMTQLYSGVDVAPSDLVHVTCTGYAAPSGAQRLVESKGWGGDTRVSHAYHMGCYAALPALRIAAGLLRQDLESSNRQRRSDVVHTEICSLHFQPLLHSPEQLVIQSLFSDGFIRYAVIDEASSTLSGPAFRLLGGYEQIVPDTADAMCWVTSDHGMQMTLAREVPERLREALPEFVKTLAARVNLPLAHLRGATYAVHPGGPRILDSALEALGLDESQIGASRQLLRTRGNMSSATLPHVWMELLASSMLSHDDLVVSLAFGPGLTLCGTVMRKVEP